LLPKEAFQPNLGDMKTKKAQPLIGLIKPLVIGCNRGRNFYVSECSSHVRNIKTQKKRVKEREKREKREKKK
jgi:hypothetical protein